MKTATSGLLRRDLPAPFCRFAPRIFRVFEITIRRLTLRQALAAAVIAIAVATGDVRAATLVVNSTSDPSEAGKLTLRDALVAAAPGDSIEFDAALFTTTGTATIVLKTPLVAAVNLTLVGPGGATRRAAAVQLKSGGSDRLLVVKSPAVVSVAGVAFQSGVAAGGGAVLVEAGADATFLECDFTDNRTTGANAGGAILNRGKLTVDKCLLARNTATNGGGIAGFGPALVARSLFEANNASNAGGAIYTSGADLRIESSTLAGNSAGTGGAFALFIGGKTATLATLTGLSVVDNTSAAQAGGLYVEGAGAVANVGGSIFARNLISNNGGAQSPRDLATQKSGKINSADYNIIVKPGTTLSPYGPHDQIGVDPSVGPLAFNGGRTRTFAIGLGGPALDLGDPAFIGGLVVTDQRGSLRVWPAGGRADVGAFEFAASLSLPAAINATATSAATSVTVTGSVVLPRGGAATAVWTVNGTAGTPVPLTLPDDCEPHDVVLTQPFPAGATPVALTITAGSLTLTASTVVTVIDRQGPEIKLLGDNPSFAEYGSTYVDPGATAYDLVDGAVPVKVVNSTVNTGALGIYSITYEASDAAGNTTTAQRTVTVRDTVIPTLSVSPASVILNNTNGSTCSFTASIGSLGLTVTAADNCDPSPTIIYEVASGSGYTAIASSYAFPIGTTQLYVSAQDSSGNRSVRQAVSIAVRDMAPPAITLNGANPLEVSLGSTFADPGVNASDLCSAPVTIISEVKVAGVVSPAGVDTCAPGTYIITYTATDAAGNAATTSRNVIVKAAVSLVADASYTRVINAATRNAEVDLATLVTVNGVGSLCASNLAFTVTITPPATGGSTPAAVTLAGAPGAPLPKYAFNVGTSTVQVDARLKSATGAFATFATKTFSIVVTDPYGVMSPNVAWPLASNLDPSLVAANGKLVATIRQMIARAGESRWYKFRGPPGSRISVALTELPANFDVVLYGDIQQALNQLQSLMGSGTASDQKLALLGAEFAPEAYSPEAYSPEAYSPEAYSPEAYSPEAYSPEAYSPEAYSPEAYSPEAYSPEAYSPEAYSPEAYSPEAYSPEAYSPEAYAAAQQRTLVGFSASPGVASEGIRFATYSQTGEFYIRVRGQNGVYSTALPFLLTLTLQQDACSGVVDLNTKPVTTVPAASGATSLILWDSVRTAGTVQEKAGLVASLTTFATAANALVVDLAQDSRIVALNAQADANPYCPIAKNLVAEAIRNLIQLYRQSAPIADITLLGNDDVIPFFRTDDRAMIASEASYFPPVKDGTQSQSSLRYAQVLSQDRYGSDCQVVLSTGPYDLPAVPVGRLVETATEIAAYLDAYSPLFTRPDAKGVLAPPASAFAAGYDFLADSAGAMRDDFAAGLGAGGRVDTLITPFGQPPAFGWTADQLRAALLGSRHDIAYLAAHFSTGRALAADYTTLVRASEIVASNVDLRYALVISAGCHSGYNTVDKDAVASVTEYPDWAQALSRKAAIWVAGTGYQYGDTDFIEYTERLLLDFARALRTGSGPVPIGRALVQAKRQYLSDTALMRGIHEKTLRQVTLYGLPMVKMNFPGARLTPPTFGSDVATVAAVASGPGAARGLKTAELSFTPTLTRVDRTLDVVGSATTQVVSYFTGRNGIVTLPGEPVRPLESFNVSRPLDGLLRGVGFRGGDYADLSGFVPFTGAPATETRGVHGGFTTEVFYPVRTWNLNQVGELCDAGGGSGLNVFPTQFISASATDGTLRKFSRMQFTLFYSPDVSAAALSNPPAINVVSSALSATGVSFDIEVAVASTAGTTPTTVGVQEVWVTYTGLPGSPLYGQWQSLSLTPPANTTGIGRWQGTLATTAPGPLVFIVQAANGVGSVTQNTNFGRYFRAGTSTLDGIGAVTKETTLGFVGTVPTTGAYHSTVAVQAALREKTAAAAVAGRRIRFALGGVTASALTDSNGVAAASLTLDTPPGSYALTASFAGDAEFGGSSPAPVAFAVTKMATQLTFASGGLVTDAAHITVNLRALDGALLNGTPTPGTPLKEHTVAFIARNTASNASVATTEITDGGGQARAASLSLAPGTYELRAYFAQTVTLPDGGNLALSDPLYTGSAASMTVTIAAPLQFLDPQAWVNYSDATAVGATADNLGLWRTEIQAPIAGATAGPGGILASAKSTSVMATVKSRLSGRVIADTPIRLRLQSNDNLHWRGSASLNGVSVELNVDWDSTGGTGKYHVWIYTPAGAGPLFNVAPALLECELIFGTGVGEHPAGGASIIGGPAAPWTQQGNNSRVKSN